MSDFSAFVTELLERVGPCIEKVQLGNEWTWTSVDIRVGDNWLRYKRFADAINAAVDAYNQAHEPDLETAWGPGTTIDMQLIGVCMNLDRSPTSAGLAKPSSWAHPRADSARRGAPWPGSSGSPRCCSCLRPT